MRWTFLGAASAAALAFVGVAPGRGEDPVPSAPRAVVVELFTSQGCSTCPPADRLLATLGQTSGGRVVPLAFHVGYWNSAGWTDPFSASEWTKRQEAYAHRFGSSQVYTPQAVVDGTAELIGSRETELRAAIATAAARPAATISLSLQPSEKEVRVAARVDLPDSLRGRKRDLMVAVYETGLVTSVERGENGGRTLANDYVVRRLARAGRIGESSEVAATFPLEKDWNRARLGVAAFLQDPETLEIRGAAAASFPAR